MNIRKLHRIGARAPFLTGSLLVTALTIGSSGLNLLTQIMLAFRFGVGRTIDSYAFALSAPAFLNGLLASIVSYTIVPLVAAEGHNPARQASLCASTAALVALLGTFILLAGIPAIWLQPRLLPPGSPIASFPALPVMILLAWAFAGGQVLVATTGAQLNATGRPLAAAALSLPPSVGAICGLALFPRADAFIALAGLLGGTILAAASGFWILRRLVFRWPDPGVIKAEAMGLIKSSVWASLGLSCFASYVIIDAFWAPRIGTGNLATLGYSQRVVVGFGSLIVAGPSALVVPRLARYVGTADQSAFLALLYKALGLVGLVGLIFVMLVEFGAEPMIRLLFARGAFDVHDLLRVANTLRHMMPGTLAMLIAVLLLRALFCIPGSGRVAAAMGIGWTLLYFVLSGFLSPLGTTGIADAYSLSWIALSTALLVYTLHRARRIGPIAER